ncbi:hydrolase [Corynebacterium dentalis]|uniref:hydrolase n=1 Tax=Corynebacterium dentalis TaxID=2014528 RepID=UPI00289674B9|nr:hydrolase [Corynebacterium dentalis]
MSTSSVQPQAETSTSRPELHVTAELGVLEAPAGAIVADGNLHVFHQFRPRADEGSRLAHQVASEVPYDWDVCDDVLTPAGNEVDVLAGSSVLLSADPQAAGPEDNNAVELFFVTSTPKSTGSASPDLLGNRIHHGDRGDRSFQIQRAYIPDVADMLDVSDDPTEADSRVERLGAIDIDDSAYPIEDLVTPNVLFHEGSWLMIALSLSGETDAEIVVLRSTDRQHWKVVGPLQIAGEANLPAVRPFSPRMVSMTDESTGEVRDVLFVTYPETSGSSESTGYVVGTLQEAEFTVSTAYTVLDHGHNFTRPRVISGDQPLLFGLVGAHPNLDSLWANCLTSPRYLSLVDGHVYQDIVGAPRAVKGYSDRAVIWTGQLDCTDGSVTADVVDKEGNALVHITHDQSSVSVTRGEDDTVTAQLGDTSSSSLAIFVDGPLCEVFVDGGATSLTSTIPEGATDVQVEVSGEASIINSMVTVGQELLLTRVGLDSPEAQERFMAEALVADREVAEGLFSEDD